VFFVPCFFTVYDLTWGRLCLCLFENIDELLAELNLFLGLLGLKGFLPINTSDELLTVVSLSLTVETFVLENLTFIVGLTLVSPFYLLLLKTYFLLTKFLRKIFAAKRV
jgi:hypothetical protein